MLKTAFAWFKGLTAAGRAGVVIASVVGISAVSAATNNNPQPSKAPEKPKSSQSTDVITHNTITETEAIAFATKKINDSSLTKGVNKTTVEGVDGERTTKYNVTYKNGVETSRAKVSEEITTRPVDEVISIGTRVEEAKTQPKTSSSSCDPNYTGCVPIASDVDCGGGSGNGPAYFYGTAQVIGYDIYGLDRDNDGYACE